MPKKLIRSKHGHDVMVSHDVRVHHQTFLHEVDIVASVGPVIHERKRITIGAVDGVRPDPPTKAELQTMLDTHRQLVADEASWKEHVRANFEGVE
jgi:hypothetical protein